MDKEKTKITTIKLEEETKERLGRLKEHPKESYNETIKKILFILNTFRKNPESGIRLLRKLNKRLKSIPQYTQVSSKQPAKQQQNPKKE